jgi:methyl-accepting chemotaxis protein
VERNAREASSLAEKVSVVVTEKGKTSVGRAVEGMNQIEEAITGASVVVRELGKHSRGIGEIVGVIGDIADQTNLLALNANILAAQAGEHGRGFHVVAGEIKSLAETTSENTKKISGIISMIQKEAAKAGIAMETGLQRAGEGVALIAEVEKTLLSVQESAELSAGATRQIARSTAEQLSGARQIAASAEVMTQMSREIAAASKEQAQGTALITGVVERMRDAASQVKNATNQQAGGAKELAATSEQTSRLAERITKAVQEQDVRSKRIGASMNRVKDVAQESTAVVLQLRGLVTSLAEQAALLRSDLERISVKRKTP